MRALFLSLQSLNILLDIVSNSNLNNTHLLSSSVSKLSDPLFNINSNFPNTVSLFNIVLLSRESAITSKISSSRSAGVNVVVCMGVEDAVCIGADDGVEAADS